MLGCFSACACAHVVLRKSLRFIVGRTCVVFASETFAMYVSIVGATHLVTSLVKVECLIFVGMCVCVFAYFVFWTVVWHVSCDPYLTFVWANLL